MRHLRELARDGDVLSGAVLAAVGTAIVITAMQWSYVSKDGPGPGFFPVWYGVLIIGLSLALVLTRILKPVVKQAEPMDWLGLGRAMMTWGAFVVAILLLPVLGFAITLTLLCMFLILAVFRRRVWEAVVSAVIIAAAFHIIFVVLLQVELPVGPLGI